MIEVDKICQTRTRMDSGLHFTTVISQAAFHDPASEPPYWGWLLHPCDIVCRNRIQRHLSGASHFDIMIKRPRRASWTIVLRNIGRKSGARPITVELSFNGLQRSHFSREE